MGIGLGSGPGRPLGQKNRPKYVGIKLSDLNKIFNQDTYIQVNPDYLSLINVDNTEIPDYYTYNEIGPTPIDFKEIE